MQTNTQRMFLHTEFILRYLLTEDDKVNTLIMCKPANLDLITNDHNLYEAFGCIHDDDRVNLHKLTKLFEVVDIRSYKDQKREVKPILRDERVQQLRKLVLEEKK